MSFPTPGGGSLPVADLLEIDAACDDLPNAMYFEQVRLSKFMRMAVLDRFLSAG